MKTSDYFVRILLCLMLVGVPQHADCQIGKVVKQASKSFVKKGAKKGTAEGVGKKATKGAGKAAAERTARELAGETAEAAIRRNVSKSLVRETNGKFLKEDANLLRKEGMAKTLLIKVGRVVVRNSEKALENGGTKIMRSSVIHNEGRLVRELGTKESRSLYETSAKKGLKERGEKATARKSGIRAGKTFTGKEALLLLDGNPTLRKQIVEMEAKYGPLFSVDNLVIKKSGKHQIIEFAGTNTKLEIKGDKLIARGGSTARSGAMNEFLNNPLPNSTYYVDNSIKYATDAQGRTIALECHSSELAKNVERTNLARQNQTELVENLGGKRGVHDSGHLQQHSTGGPNEKINLLPMKSSLQRGGKWASLEKMERDVIAAGHDVWSKKAITYKPDGSYIINVELIIKDLRTGKTKTVKRVFDNLF